jgi:hypothetical protein
MPLAAVYSNPLLDNSSSANTSFGEHFQWRYEIFKFLLVVVLIWKRCYKFIAPLELAPRVSEVIHMALQGLKDLYGYLTKVFQFQVLVRVRILVRVLGLVCVLVCPCLCPCPCPSLCPHPSI